MPSKAKTLALISSTEKNNNFEQNQSRLYAYMKTDNESN
jgi:hypothetical protein